MLNTSPTRSDRSGHYVSQSTGYKAFIPKPLPPHDLNLSDEITHLLSESNIALGRLDGSIQTLPNPDLFIFMYVRKEAVLSSQIEGTQASINDVIKAEAEIFDTERKSDANEVINYVAAMNYGLSRLEHLPLSLRLIQEIHQRLLTNVRGGRMQPGEFRRSQNWIGPKGCTLAEASFVPPPYAEVVNMLGDLETFLHQKDHMPPLIRIGLAHAQFETIHPFLDGNGRIGRLLITFFLCSNGILQKPVLYLSYFFKKNQSEYYNRLQRIRDYGEWEEWIKFFLLGIYEVANQATETARKIVSLRESHRHLIVEHFGNSSGKAMKVLESLYAKPYITVKNVRDMLGISFQNANALIQKFAAHELLSEVTGQTRNRVYLYASYVNLFSNVTD